MTNPTDLITQALRNVDGSNPYPTLVNQILRSARLFREDAHNFKVSVRTLLWQNYEMSPATLQHVLDELSELLKTNRPTVS